MKIEIPVKQHGLFIIVAISILALTASGMMAEDIKIIKKPGYTHFEKELVKLRLVHEIEDEIDDEHFLAQPTYLVPWKDGSLFIFDVGLTKIIKLDKNLKFQTQFLSVGQGPAESISYPNRTPNMSISKKGILYLSCPGNKKIIGFTTEGKLEREIKNAEGYHKSYYLPVVDAQGNIYVHSSRGGAVDVWDSKGNYLKTLLTAKAYKTFVVMEPNRNFLHNYTSNDPLNTFYDVLPDNGFIIYITSSSTVYLFKNQRLVKSFNLWPKKLFEDYAKSLDRLHYDPNDKIDSFIPFTISFFVDKDDERFFYIEYVSFRQLYKFDVDGKLHKVLKPEKERGDFLAKRNGKFYGIQKNNGRIFIYEEDK